MSPREMWQLGGGGGLQEVVWEVLGRVELSATRP